MAYDQSLADRIHELVADERDLTQKKMFGGLAFLVGGNVAVAASGQGGAMVRVDPAQSESLITVPGVALVEMRGRLMPGWIRVDSENLGNEEELAMWVSIGVAFARSLPAKQ